MGTTYESAALGRKGWWSLTHGPNAFAGRSFSGLTATEGRGWDWQPWGEFRGGSWNSFVGQYFVAFDNATLNTVRLRGGEALQGHWHVGDRAELRGDGVAGGFTGYIVRTEGYRASAFPGGFQWAASQSFIEPSLYTDPTKNPTSPIPAPGSPVFQCTTSGSFTAADPEPVLANTRWSSGAPVVANTTMVVPTHPRWNGHAYQAQNSGTTGVSEPGTGGVPAWPTTSGGTVTENGITWKEIGPAYGFQSGESTTVGPPGTGPVITWIGTVPEYNRIGRIDCSGAVTTTDATTTVVNSLPIPDNTTTSFYVRVTAYESAGTSAPDGAEFQLKAVYRSTGGIVTAVKAATVVDSNANANGTAWSAVLALSGTNVEVRVTGDVGKTIEWGYTT